MTTTLFLMEVKYAFARCSIWVIKFRWRINEEQTIARTVNGGYEIAIPEEIVCSFRARTHKHIIIASNGVVGDGDTDNHDDDGLLCSGEKATN